MTGSRAEVVNGMTSGMRNERISVGEANLITLLMTLLMVVTVVLALTIGILMGYGAIAGILWAFQHNRTAHDAAPALAHSTSGD